jgi:hypothetical protein
MSGAPNCPAGLCLHGRDRVNPDKVMHWVKARGKDRRVLQLIERSLQAGARTGDGFEATPAGTPSGGPVSPLGATLLRDGCEKEWERRGHRLVRDADESNISVKSTRAGHRGLARGSRFVARRLPGRSWACRSLGVGPTAAKGVTKPCRRASRRSVNARAGPAATHCGVSGTRCDSPSRGGTRPSALPKPRRCARSWTLGSVGASAAWCGSHGSDAGTGSGGRAGAVRTWPGIRANRPTGRGV